MASIAKFFKFDKLLEKLNIFKKAAQRVEEREVIVGYTAAYAVYVHESIGMVLQGKPRPKNRGYYWDPQGRAQAKFLEAPARDQQDKLGQIVAQAMVKGATLDQALLLAGLHLQRVSQQMVPVDTGNLKNSAFTRKA